VTEDPNAYARGMERLLPVVQELSMARDLDAIMRIVRRAARALTGSDGATFVLRDGANCYYAEEDAIEPLWKGKRFPLEHCISGWAMLHREAVVLEDIYADARIPADAYRPTFVKSLVMVPIRRLDPVGAIGNYWAVQHRPSDSHVRLLQALADSTSIAMENVELLASLESRVAERTAQLELANHELEAFSYAVSHDLRAPLRTINAFSHILVEDHGETIGDGRRHLDRICAASRRMGALIDDLLQLSTTARSELTHGAFDLAQSAREVVDELRQADPTREVEIVIPEHLPAHGDARLVRVVLENLLRNAWKFSSKRAHARIEVGAADGAFFVRDNGAGFDAARASKLFVPFQRMHSDSEFEGTGIGLATAHRVIVRHGGRIWAESVPDHGATFFFTLGTNQAESHPAAQAS
jgi:signal transduction histidine kinase